jgi:hypothetical protein
MAALIRKPPFLLEKSLSLRNEKSPKKKGNLSIAFICFKQAQLT